MRLAREEGYQPSILMSAPPLRTDSTSIQPVRPMGCRSNRLGPRGAFQQPTSKFFWQANQYTSLAILLMM